jgi:hypothetical protein
LDVERERDEHDTRRALLVLQRIQSLPDDLCHDLDGLVTAARTDALLDIRQAQRLDEAIRKLDGAVEPLLGAHAWEGGEQERISCLRWMNFSSATRQPLLRKLDGFAGPYDPYAHMSDWLIVDAPAGTIQPQSSLRVRGVVAVAER